MKHSFTFLYLKIKSEKGFSLIEVVAVVALLGIVLVPVFSMFTGASFATRIAGQETKAAAMAQATMEEFKAIGYNSLRELLKEDGEFYFEQKQDGFKRSVLLRSVKLDSIVAGAEGEVIFLEVVLSWGNEEERFLSLKSYLGERLADGP